MKWSNIWSYTQQDYRSLPSVIQNQVQVIRIRSNHHAKGLKIRFSNEYGQEKIDFDYVRLKLLEKDSLKEITNRIVKINDCERISILPSSNLISDEIFLDIKPGTIIELETFVKKRTTLHTGIVSYCRRELEVYNYRMTREEKREFIEQRKLFEMVKNNQRMFYIYGISGIDFLVKNNAKTIVAFGDSLTQQGFFVDNLKSIFFENEFHEVAVLNRGIGGSRILKGQNPQNDVYMRHGNSGLWRFEKETYMFGDVDVVLCLHGINDIISRYDGSGEYAYDLSEIKLGLQQYSALSHNHGSKIFVGTLAPLGKSIFYSPNVEKYRQEINKWISGNKNFDAVFDTNQILLDPKNKTQLKKIYECGDGLHFSDLGGRRVAEEVYSLFIQKYKNEERLSK